MKDVLSQLNTSVAINTEATKGLKEVVEKEFNRHGEDRKGLEGRITAVETQVDQIKLDMAQEKSIGESLVRFDQSMIKCEGRLEKIETRLDTKDGWSAGAFWAIGIAGTISLPCVGYVLVAAAHKLFGN